MMAGDATEGENVHNNVADKTPMPLPVLPSALQLKSFSFRDVTEVPSPQSSDTYVTVQDHSEQVQTYTEDKKKKMNTLPATLNMQASPIRPSECPSPKLEARSQYADPVSASEWRPQKQRLFDDLTTESSVSDDNDDDSKVKRMRSREKISRTITPHESSIKDSSDSVSHTQLDETTTVSVREGDPSGMATSALQTSTVTYDTGISPLRAAEETLDTPPRVSLTNVHPGPVEVGDYARRAGATSTQVHAFEVKKAFGDLPKGDGDERQGHNESPGQLRMGNDDERPQRTVKEKFDDLLDSYWEYGQTLEDHSVMMFLLTAVAFVLTLIGLPLSQLDIIGGSCYTYWGFKQDCDSHSYTNRTAFLTCSQTRKRLDVGAVFAVLTFAILSVALFFAFLVAFRNKTILLLPLIVILGFAFLTQTVSWGMIVSIYASRYCEELSSPRANAYGVAFGMDVTSWLVLLANIIVGVMPEII